MQSTIELVTCPECGDEWINSHWKGVICECFGCKTNYYREDRTRKMIKWIYEAYKRVKGEK